MRALKSRNIDVVQAMLNDDPALGILPTTIDGRAETPVSIAIRSRCPIAIIKLFLHGGESPAVLNGFSLRLLSRLDTTVRGHQFPLPSYFLDLKGQTSLQDNAPCQLSGLVSPFVRDDYDVSVAACLLQYGADPFEKDSDGKCAVDYAVLAGKLDLADLLRNWHQWQKCCEHCCLGLLPFTSHLISNIYAFLLPTKRAKLYGLDLPIILRHL